MCSSDGDIRGAAGRCSVPSQMPLGMREQRGHELPRAVLCSEAMPADRPEAPLAEHIRRYLQELFAFVAMPGVTTTNTPAERRLRPLVILRKVSGGTRPDACSTCRTPPASSAATARLRNLDPTELLLRILTNPSHAF